MKGSFFVATLLVALLSCASTFGTIGVDTVPVGNPGNRGNAHTDWDGLGGFGAVPYEFRIGKYEVTNYQYVSFLNGVDPAGLNRLLLFDPLMTSSPLGGILSEAGALEGAKYSIKPNRGNQPVVGVSYYDALRFANWMNNGQGTADTETGAYTLGPLDELGYPTSRYTTIPRNPGATWWIPSIDEWHKAAYHKNDGVTGNYLKYPTNSNQKPLNVRPPGLGGPNVLNAANYDGAVASTPYSQAINYLTDVGAYSKSPSAYGTFDQAGNVWEFTDAAVRLGGSCLNGDWNLDAFYRGSRPDDLRYSNDIGGFRVATIFVPEPSTFLLCVFAMLLLPSNYYRTRANYRGRESFDEGVRLRGSRE